MEVRKTGAGWEVLTGGAWVPFAQVFGQAVAEKANAFDDALVAADGIYFRSGTDPYLLHITNDGVAETSELGWEVDQAASSIPTGAGESAPSVPTSQGEAGPRPPWLPDWVPTWPPTRVNAFNEVEIDWDAVTALVRLYGGPEAAEQEFPSDFFEDPYGNVWSKIGGQVVKVRGAPAENRARTVENLIVDAILDDDWDSANQLHAFANQPTTMQRFDRALALASSPADYSTVLGMLRGELPIQQPGPDGRIAPLAPWLQQAAMDFLYGGVASQAAAEVAGTVAIPPDREMTPEEFEAAKAAEQTGMPQEAREWSELTGDEKLRSLEPGTGQAVTGTQLAAAQRQGPAPALPSGGPEGPSFSGDITTRDIGGFGRPPAEQVTSQLSGQALVQSLYGGPPPGSGRPANQPFSFSTDATTRDTGGFGRPKSTVPINEQTGFLRPERSERATGNIFPAATGLTSAAMRPSVFTFAGERFSPAVRAAATGGSVEPGISVFNRAKQLVPFPSARAYQRLLPSERQQFRRMIEEKGFPWQDYQSLLEQNVLRPFAKSFTRGLGRTTVRRG